MADQNGLPLSDDERQELEVLRAEKRKREAARAAQERAELEALRAEAQEEASSLPLPTDQPTQAAPHPAGKKPTSAPAQSIKDDPIVDPDNLTFGQKMVLTPEPHDPDELPPMAPAQKLIIAFALIALFLMVRYIFFR
ncbi:hypothetical protein K6V98_05900 [Collinsella sp. AGMB00827]|uniref:Uncharacterized protein n=1 Tax=Collinsella ureilytica TaxID=2869515 RepID=A0ABS7MKR4_9ACTN|nr:hypothetical protein [Collinsella urealyticum]MBY4797882.1 hypothetical protein [Collinsella urealyticum]